MKRHGHKVAAALLVIMVLACSSPDDGTDQRDPLQKCLEDKKGVGC